MATCPCNGCYACIVLCLMAGRRAGCISVCQCGAFMPDQTEYTSSSLHSFADAPICAAIDIGSNTVHLVIARCLPDTLEILADELELVRIGESVNANGMISPQKLDQTIATLQKYQALAAQYAA